MTPALAQAFYDALWQRIREQPDFDPKQVAMARRENERIAYGLTLVIGCPLPAAILGRIEELKQVYETIAPGLICFGKPGAYHLTVYGLKRSREEPFTHHELRGIIGQLRQVLLDVLGEVRVLTMSLQGSVVTASGGILVCGQENETLTTLREEMCRIDGVDRPKHGHYLNHVTIAQFRRPFGSTEAYRQAMAAMARQQCLHVGRLTVRELKLVYYRHRLLHNIAGQVNVQLPAVALPTVDEMLGQLFASIPLPLPRREH